MENNKDFINAEKIRLIFAIGGLETKVENGTASEEEIKDLKKCIEMKQVIKIVQAALDLIYDNNQ